MYKFTSTALTTIARLHGAAVMFPYTVVAGIFPLSTNDVIRWPVNSVLVRAVSVTAACTGRGVGDDSGRGGLLRPYYKVGGAIKSIYLGRVVRLISKDNARGWIIVMKSKIMSRTSTRGSGGGSTTKTAVAAVGG